MSKKDPECVKVVVRCRPLSRKEVEDQVSHARARFASFAWSVRCMCFPHRALLPGRAGPLTGRVHTQRKTIVEMNNKTGEVWLKNPEADANEQVRDAAKRGLGFEDSRRQRTSLAR
jgi:hypothetical protein